MKKGKVFIVGAGPGDPSLLTLKAFRLLREADVVVYDRLITRSILKLIPKNTRKIYIGKKAGGGHILQEEINKILVKEAKGGRRVVRLKGGDPFIFGRGGEEIEYLRENGVKFEVVPGITSALAAPAYAGIPLLHRKTSSSLAIVTGHEEAMKNRVSWDKLAQAVDTIVVLMGVGRLEFIINDLIKGGSSPQMDVAIIEWGTTKRQRTLIGDLGNIVEPARDIGIKPPSVVVIGKVAEMGRNLYWFKAPLCSKEEQ